MTPRPPVYWRDATAGLWCLIVAAGLLCSVLPIVVICSPYLLGRWLWCVCTGRPW